MDPITALVVGGLRWIAEQTAEVAFGGAAGGRITSALRDVRDRWPALAKRPEGNDIVRGLRHAQLRALERVIMDYREVGLFAKLARSDPFYEMVLAFCRSSTEVAIPQHQIQSAASGLLALAPADGDTGSEVRGSTLVEQATLDELTSALSGIRIPDGFVEHYRNGSRGKPSFMAHFKIYFDEEVKENESFRNVLQTHLLLRLGGALSRVEAGVEDLASDQKESFGEVLTGQQAGFAAVLEAIAREKGISPDPLRTILARLGEEGIPDEQISSRLTAMADAYLDLRQRWSTIGDAATDVETVRRDALALMEAGDLDGARRLFVDARAVMRAARETRTRDEAALLAGEAEVDRLQIRFLAVAARYAEAEALVAPFDPETRWGYLGKRATALYDHGRVFGDNGALTEATVLWLQAAHLRPRAQFPLDWALIQNALGSALATIGGREGGTARLDEAVKAFRAALEERTRERVPLDWAATQTNLGSVLQFLGERESGTTRLREAVVAYRAALEERTRERVPLDWAMTQNNLGNALQTLGEREDGTVRLEEAVNAYRAALGEQTRERVPLDWAMLQNNLGIALWNLGVRESGIVRLQEAVEAFRAALEEYTRERVPLAWAATQNNLGKALQTFGEREGGTARLEEAVVTLQAALEEHTRERLPLDWAMTLNNLGVTLQLIGERESGTARLREAVGAYRAALEERRREYVPLDWAETQHNLGTGLYALGERMDSTTLLEEAVQAYQAALEERAEEIVPLDWAISQDKLGNVLRALGERESGTAHLEEAVTAYRAALKVFESSGADHYIALCRRNLERAEALLRRRLGGSE